MQDENFDEILDKIEICKSKKASYWQQQGLEHAVAYWHIFKDPTIIYCILIYAYIYIFGFRSQAASWSSHTQQSSLSESVGAPHFGRSRKLACYCSRQELCFKCIGGSCVKGPLGPPRPPPASDV